MIISARWQDWTLEVYKNKITIVRTWFWWKLAHWTKGNKDINISQISSIQFKEVGTFTNWYIQFAFMGGKEAKWWIFQAWIDENTINFTKKKEEVEFLKVKEEIEKLMYEFKNSTSNDISISDELSKLSNLKEAWVLTDEEFEKAKAKLLS